MSNFGFWWVDGASPVDELLVREHAMRQSHHPSVREGIHYPRHTLIRRPRFDLLAVIIPSHSTRCWGFMELTHLSEE